MKEADINYLAVLNNLFSPLSKKRVKELGMTDEEEGKYVSRLSREIEGSGKENNVASGKQPISPWINYLTAWLISQAALVITPHFVATMPTWHDMNRVLNG